MSLKKLITSFLFFFTVLSVKSQNLPLNFKVLNEYLRREQVMGNLNEDFSFNVRPIYPEKAFPEFTDSYLTDSLKGYSPLIKPLKNKKEKMIVSPLPIQLITVFNSNSPKGWEFGELIPAKGIQTLTSAGVDVKIGKLSIQLYPQFHYVQNLQFEEYPADAPEEYFQFLQRSTYYIDQPRRFGTEEISNISLGNSHIMMNLGGINIGISTENVWTGPGNFNGMVLTDNAPGFYHFRINSNKPLKTFLGDFEGIYWVGKLTSSKRTHFTDGNFSDLLDIKSEDSWRYFTGISISYSPKWISGLSLGLTRGFQIYQSDMEKSLRAYFPIFAAFPKQGEGEIENILRREDQNVGIYARYLVPKAKSEFYFEFSRNDHPLSWRELMLNPEHSRGFLIGFTKYFKVNDNSTIGITSEIHRTQFSINNTIRWRGAPNFGVGLYDNSQVRHGWTNNGQILGGNSGISGNYSIFKIGKYQSFKEISLTFIKHEKNPNFYEYGNSNGLNIKKWIDFSSNLTYSNNYRNIIYKGNLGFTNTINENNWTNGIINEFNKNKHTYNLNISFSLSYIL